MRKPSTPLALSVIALFLALGGTSIAARHYLISNTSQIKPNVLRQLKGRAGPPGPQGGVGPTGAAGPTVLSSLTEVISAAVFVEPEHVGSAAATCPAGQRAVSGGGAAIFGAGGLNVTAMSADHLSWYVIGINEAVIGGEITAHVECAGAGQAVAATSRAHARALAEASRLAGRIETARAKTP